MHGLPEFMKINVAIAVGKNNSNGLDFFPGYLWVRQLKLFGYSAGGFAENL